MPRDAGKCYIEFKGTGKNLCYSSVSWYDARLLFFMARPVEEALLLKRARAATILPRRSIFLERNLTIL